MHPDAASLRLGRKAPEYDARTLQLSSYVDGALTIPPSSYAWSTKTDRRWPMYKNDVLGDCTCATAAHMIQTWTAAGQKNEIEVSDEDVVAMYSAVSGYDPNDPSTDQGAVVLRVLKHWRKQGLAGRKIGAFAAVNPMNKILTKDAIYLFGGIYTGLSLPNSAQRQRVWDVPAGGARGEGAPGSWGNHAAPIIDYDARGMLCVTWGRVQRLTWEFYRTYCEEAYAILSPDFLQADKAPNGFDLHTLQADLLLLGR